MEVNESFGEKARWEIYKDTACCFEQNLEAASYKPFAVRLMVVWLFGFYGISTFVGHLNYVYIYTHTYSTKDFKTNIKVGRIFS